MSDCTCYGYHEHYKATGDTLVYTQSVYQKQTTALLSTFSYVSQN